MKLTVISAAYNVLSGVGLERMTESIRSVASIPIEHEHLIFDGASADGTVEVLRKLEGKIPSLKVVSGKDSGDNGVVPHCNRRFLPLVERRRREFEKRLWSESGASVQYMKV